MARKPKPRTAEVVRSSYQPTKAELEEEVRLDIPGDTVEDRMKNLAKAMQGPVNFRFLNRPRTRR
jgi:hypothetical protein